MSPWRQWPNTALVGLVVLAIWAGCRTKSPYQPYVLSLAFSADGKRLSAGTQDGKVVVWDIDCDTESCRSWRMTTLDFGYPVLSVAFLSDGSVAATGNTSYLRVWEPDDWKEETVRSTQPQFTGMQVIANGDALVAVSSGPTITTFQLRPRASTEYVRLSEFNPWHVEKFPQSDDLLLADDRKGCIVVYDPHTKRIRQEILVTEEWIKGIAVARERPLSAIAIPRSGQCGATLEGDKDGSSSVTIVDLQSGRVLGEVWPEVIPLHVALSPNGALLAVMDARKVQLIEWKTGTTRHLISLDRNAGEDCEFSPDGRMIAVGKRHYGFAEVDLFDCESGQIMGSCSENRDYRPRPARMP